MSIADKLTAIAENVQKVYNAGKAAGGGGEDHSKYMTRLENIFNGASFPDGHEITLCLDSLPTTAPYINSAFVRAVGLRKITLSRTDGATLQNVTAHFFAPYISTLEVLDISNTNIVFARPQSMFAQDTALKRIIGKLDFSGATSDTSLNEVFYKCEALEEVRFTPQTVSYTLFFGHSAKLSDESVQSILDGFADMTGKTSPTLTLHATVGTRLTEEQKAALTAKNITLVY